MKKAKRRGQPPKKASEKKSARLDIACTKDQLRRFKLAAKARDLSVPEWARQILMDYSK